MNTILPTSFLKARGALVATVGLLAGGSALAAGTNSATAPSGATAAAKNDAPTAVQIPKSEYSVPVSAAQGRDPFFPDSRRGAPVTAKVDSAASAPITPTLQGISGQFALINNRTLKVGEDTDVTINRTKVHLHLISIKPDSAIVEVEGQPMELRLKPGL